MIRTLVQTRTVLIDCWSSLTPRCVDAVRSTYVCLWNGCARRSLGLISVTDRYKLKTLSERSKANGLGPCIQVTQSRNGARPPARVICFGDLVKVGNVLGGGPGEMGISETPFPLEPSNVLLWYSVLYPSPADPMPRCHLSYFIGFFLSHRPSLLSTLTAGSLVLL